MQLSRRRFLLLGLGTGALALLIGLPAARTRETVVLDALSDALFAGAPLPLPSEIGAGEAAWAHAAALPWEARAQLRGLLRGIEWGAVLAAGARFSHLDLEARQALLARLGSSSADTSRRALGALKQLCAIGTFSHPRVWAAIGYDGPHLPPRAP